MQIKQIKYNKPNKEILIDIVEFPDRTFVVNIDSITKKNDLINELNNRINKINAAKAELDAAEQKYNSLMLSSIQSF